MSSNYRRFYIDGQWRDPQAVNDFAVINPATEQAVEVISLGSEADIDVAVAAARAAFPGYSRSSVAQRRELLGNIIDAFKRRYDEIAEAITLEIGAPSWLAAKEQAVMGIMHTKVAMQVLENYPFREDRGTTRLLREPIGVCGLITPWNWPINQIACKVIPALATGCTVVLKPSKIAPLSACLWAEVMHEAGVPAGVFYLVNGDGSTLGSYLAGHPEVDMLSFTGSNAGGVAVARQAAATVKRVHQELGGKSANIILDQQVLAKAVKEGGYACFKNSGQSCNAPSRMLVPEALHDHAVALACSAAAEMVVGDPRAEGTKLGPLVSRTQWESVQGFIERGREEGATLAFGGPGKPEGLEVGYYARPTIFANVSSEMEIAREEVFGPVLAIMPYRDEADAVRIANDSCYGLSGYISGSDSAQIERVAAAVRTGTIHINGAMPDFHAPFGGYKQSGNGREWGEQGFEAFVEIKSLLGINPPTAN